MEKVNYKQLYTKLTKGLSPKTKDIFDRRFGVKSGNLETLESIGDRLGITRERVRQIEEVGFNFVKKNNKETLDTIFKNFRDYLESQGGFKKEEVILQELGGANNKPYVLFLLTLGSDFVRVCGKKDYHYFWLVNPEAEGKIKDTLHALVSDIEDHGALLKQDELVTKFALKHNIDGQAIASYVEISKRIQENKEGKLGLANWPEINPRGVKDKAFLVFKQSQEPLHFRKITELIDGLGFSHSGKKTHPQTVHNELIKDTRFVLVGRGTYALAEWGYVPGTIKDIITKVLNEKKEPTHQDHVLKEVMAQRLVAKNTILINLNNKKYFNKDDQGRYFLQKTESA